MVLYKFDTQPKSQTAGYQDDFFPSQIPALEDLVWSSICGCPSRSQYIDILYFFSWAHDSVFQK